MKKGIILCILLIAGQAQAVQFNFLASIFGTKKYSIKNYGTYRAWGDGTIAKSCDEYKTPALPYRFAGEIASFGTYRIQETGAPAPYDVDCDFANNANGTLNAYGGSVTYSGNYRIHTFASSNNLVINRGSGTAEYLVVGGGGGASGGVGGVNYGSGGGGGRVISGTMNPAVSSYSIIVGTGGAGSTTTGGNGTSSSITGIITATGGYGIGTGRTGGGNDLYSGGNNSVSYNSGGGAGAGGSGSGSAGGIGVTSSISGSSIGYGGGGGGSGPGGATSASGSGGSNPYANGILGGGGAGGDSITKGGSGGNGIVIVRYIYKK